MKNLIKKYQSKIESCDKSLNSITELMIKGETDQSIDVIDLMGEKENCIHDREIYKGVLNELKDYSSQNN